MPTIDENYEAWSNYAWTEKGDEWSAAWGGSRYLWYGAIFPRIWTFLPAHSILEIAPGYGRCTQYLLTFCREMAVVDLVGNCINACKKRFETSSHIRYFVNDGKTLDMIEDESIDFVFSWDSLVHAESDVLSSYLNSLALKLKKGGVGFIHHSNLGAFVDNNGELKAENPHWRATSMSAELFRKYCSDAGLACVSQEIIAWGSEILNDCFSLFLNDRAAGHSETRIVENLDFMLGAHIMRNISQLYNVHSPEST